MLCVPLFADQPENAKKIKVSSPLPFLNLVEQTLFTLFPMEFYGGITIKMLLLVLLIIQPSIVGERIWFVIPIS